MLEKKCNYVGCDNIIVDVNKKTTELKKFCSNKCRYNEHSKVMTQHLQFADAPLCKYEECSAPVSKKTTGHWKIYCSPQCQNIDVAFRKSDFFGTLPPKCKSADHQVGKYERKRIRPYMGLRQRCMGMANKIK